jgi:hypothetical protein
LAISYSSPTRMGSRYDYNFKMVYLYLSQGSKKCPHRLERIEHHIGNSSPRYREHILF